MKQALGIVTLALVLSFSTTSVTFASDKEFAKEICEPLKPAGQCKARLNMGCNMFFHTDPRAASCKRDLAPCKKEQREYRRCLVQERSPRDTRDNNNYNYE